MSVLLSTSSVSPDLSKRHHWQDLLLVQSMPQSPVPSTQQYGLPMPRRKNARQL